jgi:YVTN family beta-propeller protein
MKFGKRPIINLIFFVIVSTLIISMIFNYPAASAVTVKHDYLYVISSDGNSLSVIDPDNESLITTVDGVMGLRYLAASPDGKKLYATGFYGLYVINTSTNTATKITNDYGEYGGIAVNPRGNEYYVGARDEAHIPYVLVLNAQNDAVIMRFGLGMDGVAKSLAVSPDGNLMYVATQKSNWANFSVYNLTTRAKLTTKSIVLSNDIAVKPDGSEVYVACADTENFVNTVYAFDSSGNMLKYRINDTNGPTGVALSPDGSLLYITNYYGTAVSVFDTNARAVKKVIELSKSHPNKIAVTPDGAKIYVSHGGNVDGLSVIDASDYSVSYMDNINGSTNEMAICEVSFTFKPLPVTVNPGIMLSPTPAPSLASTPVPTASPSSPGPTSYISPSPTINATPVATPSIAPDTPQNTSMASPTVKPTPGFDILMAIVCMAGATFIGRGKWRK